MVKNLLKRGLIQPNFNPFSSLVFLVRKAYKIWKLYMDYRAFNQQIITDKFPISMIDKLLDELQYSLSWIYIRDTTRFG